jgi:phosphatidylglycerol---prolipoprotein diacylglyceryl transferase
LPCVTKEGARPRAGSESGILAGVIPFLHLGPLTIPTYGLSVAVAMLAAFWVLREDLKRRGLSAQAGDAETWIALPCLAGFAGAKLYHLLETPREFFADPWHEFFSSYGFAWFGGLLGGFAMFLWLTRRRRVPVLAMLDAGSPAAALGYGIGRIGCLLSGDGDYGIPTSLPWGMSFPDGLVPTTQRVHPTPIYELIAACAIAWWLWRMGAQQVKPELIGGDQRIPAGSRLSPEEIESARAKFRAAAAYPQPALSLPGRLRMRWKMLRMFPLRGDVFAAYLVLTGIARFLVEFIRINPRSFFGLTNAQAASLASVAAGAALVWRQMRK